MINQILTPTEEGTRKYQGTSFSGMYDIICKDQSAQQVDLWSCNLGQPTVPEPFRTF